MSKQANAKQDFYKEAHEAALALRQAKDTEAQASQAAIAAETAFRRLLDPFRLFNTDQLKWLVDKWADDPPTLNEET